MQILPSATAATTAPLASLSSLTLRCLDIIQPHAAAGGGVHIVMQEEEPARLAVPPLSLVSPRLTSLNLNPQFLPHYDSSIDKLAGN
jgi:hypothetical protein